MTPLPDLTISAARVHFPETTEELNLAVNVSMAAHFSHDPGWCVYNLKGELFCMAQLDPQVDAYIKAHYFPSLGFWLNPAAIVIHQAEPPHEIPWLIEKAGLTQISKNGLVSLKRAVLLKPGAGEVVLRSMNGTIIPFHVPISPQYRDAVTAAARAAGWIPQDDGSLLNPAHQDCLEAVPA